MSTLTDAQVAGDCTTAPRTIRSERVDAVTAAHPGGIRRAGIAFGVVALIATGCTTAAEPDGSMPTTSLTSAVSSTTSIAPTTSEESDTFGEFIPPPPAVAVPSAELREQLGPYADLVLGGGAVLRGSKEHLDYIASCVAAGGFAVEADPTDGSVQGNHGPEQEEQFRVVLFACDAAAREHGLIKPSGPATRQELELSYRAFLIAHDCLIEHGYPTTEPPSLEVYVQSGGFAWHPFDNIYPHPLSELEAVCTQDLAKLVVQLVETER